MEGEAIKRAARDTMEDMEIMTDDERMMFFGIIFEKYCRFCGTEHGSSYCQCWNDE